MKKTLLIHLLFVAGVVALGLLSGLTNLPGTWYQSLQKPVFNPPAWIFGPVWSTLYVLIGVAGARIWLRAPGSTAMRLWFLQLILNIAWSPAFFGAQSPVAGLVVIVPMLLAVLGFIVAARPLDRIAAWLFVPYALWVAFATVLTLSIVLLN